MKAVVALLVAAVSAAVAAECDCDAMQSEIDQLRYKDKVLPIATIIGGCQAVRGVTEAAIGAAYGAMAPVVDPIWAEASKGVVVALEQADTAKAAGAAALAEALAALKRLPEENPQLQPAFDALNSARNKAAAGVAQVRSQGRSAVAGVAPQLADHAAIVADAALGMVAFLGAAFFLAAVVKPLLGAVLGLCCVDCSAPRHAVSKKQKNRLKGQQEARKAAEETRRREQQRKREQDQAKAQKAAKKRANAEAARR